MGAATIAMRKRGRPRRGAERSFDHRLKVAWQYLALGMTATAVAQFNGISRATVHRDVESIKASKDPRAVALLEACEVQEAV